MRKRNPKDPSPELQEKVRKAAEATIRNQKRREIYCPYCRGQKWIVFEDSHGHVQTKCTVCGKDVVIDVVNMRRMGTVKTATVSSH